MAPQEQTTISIATTDNNHQHQHRARSPNGHEVHWHHEPSADGESIVVFSSIPKQIAQQQQLASVSNLGSPASSMAHSSFESCAVASCARQSIDLVQFDSVFVSPILARSLLEEGHIRLRVYSQCKYVNESCLAELKLPLKRLLQAPTRDNLGDAMTSSASNNTTAALASSGAESNNNNNNNDHVASVPQHPADLILNNLLANLVTASTGSPLSTLIEQISAEEEEGLGLENGCRLNDDQASSILMKHGPASEASSFRLADWLTSGSGEKGTNGSGSGSGSSNSLQRASNSLGAALNYLGSNGDAKLQQTARGQWPPVLDREGPQHPGEDCAAIWQNDCDKLIEQNYCRSLMVSHWLNYLVAPSYECQLVEEHRGQLVLGLTYLPTSNRIIFNAHRATLMRPDTLNTSADKQLIKKLRLHSDTSYLLRFLMVANNRVIRRKQTACARKPEWDSQEPVTFDLVSVQVDQPSFIVALVMRNPHSLACQTSGGSLQSLTSYHQVGGDSARAGAGTRSPHPEHTDCCQSDPESLRLGTAANGGGAAYRPGSELHHQQQQQLMHKGKRDLVIGHFVLAKELWQELKTQPRRQLIKQFKLL